MKPATQKLIAFVVISAILAIGQWAYSQWLLHIAYPEPIQRPNISISRVGFMVVVSIAIAAMTIGIKIPMRFRPKKQ